MSGICFKITREVGEKEVGVQMKQDWQMLKLDEGWGGSLYYSVYFISIFKFPQEKVEQNLVFPKHLILFYF